jgi:hypothetical protein
MNSNFEFQLSALQRYPRNQWRMALVSITVRGGFRPFQVHTPQNSSDAWRHGFCLNNN